MLMVPDNTFSLNRHPVPVFLVVLLLAGCSGGDPPEYVRDGDNLYVNTAKDVRYVGSAACGECHRELYESFMKTTTARSMVRLDTTNVIEQYPQQRPVYDPTLDFYYEMIRRGDRFYQREFRLDEKGNVIHERFMEAQYAIGSGKNLRMYFYDENGMLYELPLTWYVHRNAWDLSPGYREFGNLRFARFAGGKCLACHNDHMEISPVARERFLKPYPLGVGCEACHGPGDLHVRQERGESVDLPGDNARTIVNPIDLSPQRQIDVCQQCHLQGKAWALQEGVNWNDFRPGMRLEDCWSVYTHAETKKEAFKVADSAHRFAQSRCYKESHGVTTCNTCHDSHGTFHGSSVEFNRRNCQQCHPPESLPGKGSKFAHGPKDNCVPCHMKQTGTQNTLHGVINTDHWIRIDADKTEIDWTEYRTPLELQGPHTLTPFVDRPDSARFQRRGIAWLDYYRNYDRQDPYLDSAYHYLSNDLRLRGPSARTLSSVGEVYRERQLNTQARTSYTAALALDPDDADAWSGLGAVCRSVGSIDSAILCYRKAVALLPGEPTCYEGLGMALAGRGMIRNALDTLKEALRIDRYNPEVYATIGNLYALELGQPAQALPFFRERAMLDPDAATAYINLGNVYTLLGQYDRAIRTYQAELHYRPASALALFNLAKLYRLEGDDIKANEAMNRAMQIDPSISGLQHPGQTIP